MITIWRRKELQHCIEPYQTHQIEDEMSVSFLDQVGWDNFLSVSEYLIVVSRARVPTFICMYICVCVCTYNYLEISNAGFLASLSSSRENFLRLQ